MRPVEMPGDPMPVHDAGLPDPWSTALKTSRRPGMRPGKGCPSTFWSFYGKETHISTHTFNHEKMWNLNKNQHTKNQDNSPLAKVYVGFCFMLVLWVGRDFKTGRKVSLRYLGIRHGYLFTSGRDPHHAKQLGRLNHWETKLKPSVP